MTSGGGGRDPFEDLFAHGDYEPSLAFAITAASQAAERAKSAEALVNREVSLYAERRNSIAVSARKSVGVQLAALLALGQQTVSAADEARHMAAGSAEHAVLVSKAIESYDRSVGAYDDLMVTVQQLSEPDTPMPAAPQLPLPTTQDADSVAKAARQDALTWIRAARTDIGKLCVLRNSPGVGKTETIIDAALDEQNNKRRAIIAVRTKDQLTGANPEMIRRIQKKTPFMKTRLHVILGRDETNCPNFDNVKAVQAHGYAPGRTVCLGCEFHPRNAYSLGLPVCDYFQTRIRAHNDSRGARIGAHATYPLIATNHASLVAAFDTGGGQYGAFWGCDTIFVDEDCTDSFESVTTLTADQAAYSSPRPEDLASTVMARIYREAIALADRERAASEGVGFKIEGEAHPNHRRGGSTYAGASLHSLIERARTTVAQSVRVGTTEAILRDVVEGSSFTTEAGRLYGLTNAAAINLVVPPIALSTVSNTLLDEMRNVTQVQRYLYDKVRGHPPRADTAAEVRAELRAHTDLGDFSYATRLEWSPANGWQFAAQGFAPLHNHVANVVVGDAYAQVAHYERLFERTCDKLVDRVAHYPPGARIVRLLTKSTITHLKQGFVQENLALLEAAIAAEGPGKRVLLYGHSELRDRVEEWMKGIAGRYGIVEWAFEHWWGGRGKDFYNGWDVYLQVSEPIQNIDGMLHVVNARAFRDAMRSKTHEERRAHTERVRFDIGPHMSFAHAMRASHEALFREHERQNINEQTQAINRLRPVWNEVACYVPGSEVEMSRDLLAATVTVAPRDGRKANAAKSRRRGKRVVGPLDAFLTSEEALAAMLAIVEWFGVWSGTFAHALVAVSLDFSEVSKSTDLGSNRISHVTFKNYLLRSRELLPHMVTKRGPEWVPDEGQDGAPKTCPAPPFATLARRVWSPPVYWRRLNEAARRIHAIQEATAALQKTLPSARCDRWPSWRGRGPGRKPLVYYDPGVFGDALRPDLALDLYYGIVDRQYGPSVDGRLVAPNAVPDVPMSWGEVPF